ncbi:glycosyltransferase family 2 protein [Marinobacter nauticus]|uniref:glycosyltransferase family 2 protein n=1 Tax=Marinobacter nauticus TaxID=2743 RepID=UPI000EAD2B5E|nr:glycosyltransferase family 2 protein [Marinobacter nauticus]MBW3197571.1 glycosyltransferase [Marinobacter nauticus]MBY6182981.1 glycosyltransferase [Marinobacter nauticus]RKR77526.1 glycosyl transferase family 2 [Marinobacter nauticus]
MISIQPRVSVVMPAYNASAFIAETIQSVLGQSVEDWELIVVDDCSTDSTREVVTALSNEDSRIRLIALDKNFGGPAGPRNVGVKAARAELVAFLDSDDIWHPEKLRLQLEVINNTEAAFVCTAMTDFVDEGRLSFASIDNVEQTKVTYWRQTVRAQIPTSSVIASKALLMRAPFREDPDYKAVEDYHCWLQLLQMVGSCVKLQAPLLYYRRSEGQISGSKLMMMKKVLMVHREYPGRSHIAALVFTFTHVLGGLYFRFLKKGM